MKHILAISVLLFIIIPTFSQSKRKGKVKRKYRDIEQVSKQLQPVFIHGEIYDRDRIGLAGASVSIDGTAKGVNSNENGEFLIENLQTGKARIRISYIGFKTKTIDYELRPGENFYKIMLTQENIHIEPVAVNAQKREQQLLDVPAAIIAIGATTIEQNNITELGQLSEFVPGLYIREQGANRPSFVMRGLTSDEVSPSAQPRISTYYNNVPINRASSSSVELFDMEQVEILKGPQNTLFGRGAQAGAVHF
ncbi:MAG: TonB-dependent receptor, partial [Bacteroidetes bacterium]|nr:TonB-dependent receptor [Bacteroidota bacterium]